MIERRLGIWAALFLLALLTSVGSVKAAAEEDGFFIFLNAAMATPQNTDEVIATEQAFTSPVQSTRPITMGWSSDVAGKIGLGYRWGSRESVSLSYWRFDSDEKKSGDGPAAGFLNWGIGPAIAAYDADGYSAGYVGQYGQPGHFDMKASIKAENLDLSWGHTHGMTETFSMGWSVGLRYAKFEETLDGGFDSVVSGNLFYTGTYLFAASKRNEGKMTGVKAGVRGTRKFGSSFSVTSGLSLSLLGGKVTSSSSLVPNGSVNAPLPPNLLLDSAVARAEDKHRSGMIRDFDLTGVWRLAGDRFLLSLGWEQSSWDGVPTDLLRNTAGTLVALQDRKNVTFSGVRVGFAYLF